MYYWNKNTENKSTLEEELFSFASVSEIYVGTAFFSKEGLRILSELALKYKIKKNNIKLFLSSEFSQDQPHELLRELLKICTVGIIFNKTFHAKIYWIKGSAKSKLIYGSSNFTNGGFKNNIEFDSIEIVDNSELTSIEKFFHFCEFQSTIVDEDVINYYEENLEIILELQKVQKKIKKKLNGYIHQEDALDKDDLNIEDYYFNFEDYETFFIHNQTRDDSDIRERRKKVQDKMLFIHKRIYPTIKKLGVECHWRPKNITSVIKPCVYNKGRVGWMGVRYGKTKDEVMALNFNGEDLIIGFQKHACLQYCIVPSGFEINLFFAVKHDAVDRAHIHEHLDKLRPKIEKELAKLQGYNMTWEIYDEELDKHFTFDIDNENAENFCNYLKKYDQDGRESYLSLSYEADDPTLEDVEGICNDIVKYFKLLLPLYNSMIFRPGVTKKS